MSMQDLNTAEEMVENNEEVGSQEVVDAVSPASNMTHLKMMRKKNGYTLETLSKVTNISISYLSRLESGSRRLNSDLVRRLSHAFGCDPTELMQEVENDRSATSPADYSVRGRANGLLRQFRMTQRNEPMKDVPVYCLSKESTDEGDRIVLLRTAPVDWRYRPVELVGRDVFAIKSGSHFAPHFSSTAIIYLSAGKDLAPENIVIIAPEHGDITLKRVWSVTPTSIQVCDYDKIEDVKSGKISPKSLEVLENDSIQEIYKVVGYSDFSL